MARRRGEDSQGEYNGDTWCTDGNNILNPIGSDDIIGYFGEIEAEELARAEALGIYAEAEIQLKSIITHYFAAFPDYTVCFTTA